MKTFMLIILILLSQSFSNDFSVIVSPKVTNFIEGHSNNSLSTFRSGLLNKDDQSIAFSESSIENSIIIDSGYNVESVIDMWRKGNHCEYSLISNEKAVKLLKILNKRLAHKSCEVTYDSIRNEYRIKTANKNLSTIRLDKQALIKVAESEFEKYLPFFKKHAEYDFYMITNKNDTLESVVVCYRRVFNHGIVRSNASSVNIQIDAYGNLMQIFFTWPSFDKINGDMTSNSVKITDNLIDILNSELKQYTEIENDGSMSNLEKAEINGITFGWFLADINDVKKLTPCYTFSTNLYYNDGEKIGQIISIPILKKYYPDQK
jgi:hypothetical protein